MKFFGIFSISLYFLIVEGYKLPTDLANEIKSVCSQGGQYHVYPYDCHYFIQCSNGIPYRQKCATPLYWNQKRLTCQWSGQHCNEEVNTTTTMSTTTAKLPTNTTQILITETAPGTSIADATSASILDNTSSVETSTLSDSSQTTVTLPESLNETTKESTTEMVTIINTSETGITRPLQTDIFTASETSSGMATITESLIETERTTNTEISSISSEFTDIFTTAPATKEPLTEITDILTGASVTAIISTFNTEPSNGLSTSETTMENSTNYTPVLTVNAQTPTINEPLTEASTTIETTKELSTESATNPQLVTENTTVVKASTPSTEIPASISETTMTNTIISEFSVEDQSPTSLVTEITTTRSAQSFTETSGANLTDENSSTTQEILYSSTQNLTNSMTTMKYCTEGDIDITESCEYYIQCIDGEKTIIKCPDGTFWNQLIVACTIENSHCTDTTSYNAASTVASETTGTLSLEFISNLSSEIAHDSGPTFSTSHNSMESGTTSDETIESSTAAFTSLWSDETTNSDLQETTVYNGANENSTTPNENFETDSRGENEITSAEPRDSPNYSDTTEDVTSKEEIISSIAIEMTETTVEPSNDSRLTRSDFSNRLKVSVEAATTLNEILDDTSETTQQITAADASICASNNTEYHVDQNNCTKFIKCVNGEAQLGRCPDLHYYNAEQKICLKGECPQFATSDELLATSETYDGITNELMHACANSNQEYLADPYDCIKFIECVNGQANVLNCPEFYYWSADQGICVKGICSQTTTFAAT